MFKNLFTKKGSTDCSQQVQQLEQPQETEGYKEARGRRLEAEQLLEQSRKRRNHVNQVTNRAKEIVEANNFVKTIDLVMERR